VSIALLALGFSGALCQTTDFETRGGTCQIPVPQAFTCRSIPEWGSFLEAMRAAARAGFPAGERDGELLHQASDLLTRYGQKPYPPQDFFKYLCGGDKEEWPLSDRFCLYGFVGALFVRSRHLMSSEDPEVRKAVDMDLQYATTVLGKEGAVDFLDDAPWPVSILDVYLNINETEFMTYDQYIHTNPIPEPVVPLASLHWRPPLRQPSLAVRVMPTSARMAVIGTHATLSLEPVDMLRRFVQDVPLQAIFYGLEPRWCQILGVCDQGSAAFSQLFKDAEKDPYAFSWAVLTERIAELYDRDTSLQAAEIVVCTEPLAGCLMLSQVAKAHGKDLPLIGYLGVALLNSCPPEDVPTFWRSLAALGPFSRERDDGRVSDSSVSGARPNNNDQRVSAVLAVNNLILSEQIYFQTGWRVPYVRAHGLYTGMSYVPTRQKQVLVWRAPLFVYTTVHCTILRFLEGMPDYPIAFRFVDEDESVPYQDMASYKAVMLLPWDHALMTFYELYSAAMPIMLPSAEWMYRLLYQRGQLSVGERMYQSIMPGHTPPLVEFAEAEVFKESPGPPNTSVGMSSAKAARGVAEDMLTRGLAAPDLETTKQYVKAALELMQDMRYFLAVADNRTHEDSYTSAGVVRRSVPQPRQVEEDWKEEEAKHAQSQVQPDIASPLHDGPWHPYTPFQMSTRDSNDWTRMRKGGWWLRRGIRFDAMRYWYQYSDFARFPGLLHFPNVAEFLCMSRSLEAHTVTEQMRRYNQRTLVHSAEFWAHALVESLGRDPASVPATS